jgi:hypothetical protein
LAPVLLRSDAEAPGGAPPGKKKQAPDTLRVPGTPRRRIKGCLGGKPDDDAKNDAGGTVTCPTVATVNGGACNQCSASHLCNSEGAADGRGVQNGILGLGAEHGDGDQFILFDSVTLHVSCGRGHRQSEDIDAEKVSNR